MATTAQKRSAPPSSPQHSPPAKKQKVSAHSDPYDDAVMTDAIQPPSTSSFAADEPVEVVVPTTNNKGQAKKKAVTKAPPIADLFTPFNPELPPLPKFNPAWGTIPMPGPDGPQSYPDQPPARSSNAQTVPPLWEDRKFRFQKGSRYVRTFRRGEQVPKDTPAALDQEGNLVLHLIDMRPKSRKDPTPRRMPYNYIYQNGTPRDWNNKQVIKALNDRRQQAIDRVTMDPPWTEFEREYLLEILEKYPDASIKEIADRFNWRFKDQEYAKTTAFSWDHLSVGRTIESIRYEYLAGKHKYDQGEIPKKKELADRHPFGKGVRNNPMEIFGKRDKAFDGGSEDEDSDAEVPVKSRKKTKAMRIANFDPKETSDESDDDSGEELNALSSPYTSNPSGPVQLSGDDEELLDLAGYNDVEPEDDADTGSYEDDSDAADVL